MLCRRVETAVAALGGNTIEAIEDVDRRLATEPVSKSLSREQRDLRRALGVL